MVLYVLINEYKNFEDHFIYKIKKKEYIPKKVSYKGPFSIYGPGGDWWNFFKSHYELPWPPFLSPYFFSSPPTPPPPTVIFGGEPPFKRDIIIIKPDMHRFCSVQYDSYFLFNVKLLTSHSTDVAATSVLIQKIRILYQLHLFLSVVFAALMDQGLQDSFGEANALRLPSPCRS